MQLLKRARGYYNRLAARRFAQRTRVLHYGEPLVSFTFDDFPKSALHTGATILEQSGFKGTYFVSIGLAGTIAPTGEIVDRAEIPQVVARGHELACHTYHHHHATQTAPTVFESSVQENARALQELIPGAHFLTHSYPIGVPKPGTKRRCAKYFLGCRAGGQIYNEATVDLDHLQAYFLEQNRDDVDGILRMVDQTIEARGWLIFATHDVDPSPTRYGVTPQLFERVVRYVAQRNVRVLPIASVLQTAAHA